MAEAKRGCSCSTFAVCYTCIAKLALAQPSLDLVNQSGSRFKCGQAVQTEHSSLQCASSRKARKPLTDDAMQHLGQDA
jgi:hypothetical protein